MLAIQEIAAVQHSQIIPKFACIKVGLSVSLNQCSSLEIKGALLISTSRFWNARADTEYCGVSRILSRPLNRCAAYTNFWAAIVSSRNVRLGIKHLFSRLENADQRAIHMWSLIGHQSLHLSELSAIYRSCKWRENWVTCYLVQPQIELLMFRKDQSGKRDELGDWNLSLWGVQKWDCV